jgi:hypothetical protein
LGLIFEVLTISQALPYVETVHLSFAENVQATYEDVSPRLSHCVPGKVPLAEAAPVFKKDAQTKVNADKTIATLLLMTFL